MKLPTIKRKLPEVFTDENNYFGKNQSWIDTWHSCNTCVLYCVILAIPAIYLQWWWIVPILAFVGLMASSIAGAIEGKAGTTDIRIWNTPMRWALLFGGHLTSFSALPLSWGLFIYQTTGGARFLPARARVNSAPQ